VRADAFASGLDQAPRTTLICDTTGNFSNNLNTGAVTFRKNAEA
jgi:hypothetical protein